MSDIPTLVARLKKQLKAEKDQIEKEVASGGCQSFDTYKWKTGVYRGISIAEEIISDWQRATVLDTTWDGED